jgi:hypothetical protein
MNRRGDRPRVTLCVAILFITLKLPFTQTERRRRVDGPREESMPVRHQLHDEPGGATRRCISDRSLATKMTTLSGGSLGSCVDEERSQLRELM